jgi:hypothetical protein
MDLGETRTDAFLKAATDFKDLDKIVAGILD